MNKRRAEEMAIKDPYKFFVSNVDFEYPELKKVAAENLIQINIYYFFGLELDLEYPEFARIAAETIFKQCFDESKFFVNRFHVFERYKIHKKFPELVLKIG